MTNTAYDIIGEFGAAIQRFVIDTVRAELQKESELKAPKDEMLYTSEAMAFTNYKTFAAFKKNIHKHRIIGKQEGRRVKYLKSDLEKLL